MPVPPSRLPGMGGWWKGLFNVPNSCRLRVNAFNARVKAIKSSQLKSEGQSKIRGKIILLVTKSQSKY